MKIGTETGSLVNGILTDKMQIIPEIGMGATICHWSDRIAGTIIEVKKDKNKLIKFITIQVDNAIRTDSNGMSESQVYEYTPDSDGMTYIFKLRKDGTWKRSNSADGLIIGTRIQYYDYSF